VLGSDGGTDASLATDAAIETKTGNNQEVKIDMPKFKELDSKVTLAEQMQLSGGPIVLINVFTIDPTDEEALINAWSHDADFGPIKQKYQNRNSVSMKRLNLRQLCKYSLPFCHGEIQ
jgi:hypothetical protein